MLGGHGGGDGQAGELGAPEALVLGGIGPLQPRDVVPERRPRRRCGRPSRLEGFVEREDLLEEQAGAPAVQQQVVVAPDEAPVLLGHPHPHHPHQRGSRQLEAAPAFVLLQPRQPGLLLLGGQVPPVMLLERQRGVRVHHLEGGLQVVPHEAGAQDGVSVHHRLPRLLEQRDVHVRVDRPGALLEIEARVRRAEGMEQHALLERGERIDVLHGGALRGQQPVERGLGDARQGEVPRRHPAGVFRVPLRDERAQGREEALRQRFDGGRVVQVVAVAEVHPQPPLPDRTVDGQQVRPEGLRVHRHADGFIPHREQGAGVGGAVKLAQVVEGHLRLGEGRHPLTDFARPHEAQEPIADAVVGPLTQRVAHRAQAVTMGAAHGQAQQRGRHGREPAHRAGHVHVREQLLAAMAFQVDERAGLAGPLT
ncbi:hypothetical protein COSO111634_35310 [Corallococcus soli]